jgi:hypothetical protein
MMKISTQCSAFYTYEDLFHCGQTWQQHRMYNIPMQDASWLAYEALAQNILDPLTNNFGRPELTYGFCGPALLKKIREAAAPGIAPKLDQHSACELNRRDVLICPRQGAAVDLCFTSISSLEIAQWLVKNTAFDRLYFYGASRPVHVSFGPEHKRQIVLIQNSRGRRIPQVITVPQLEGLISC